jgi:hypothetical protein
MSILLAGRSELLKMALRGNDQVEVPDWGFFYLGLCTASAMADSMSTADVQELPAIAGYQRQKIERNSFGWPIAGDSFGQVFLRSKSVLFSPSADWASFDRMFLCATETGNTQLFALTTPLVTPKSLTTLSSPTDREVFMEIYLS